MSTPTLLLTPLLVLVLLLTALQLARLVQGWTRDDRGAAVSDGSHEAEALADDKERLLGALRDLEYDYAMNKLSREDYDLMRRRLERDAVQVIERLDGEG